MSVEVGTGNIKSDPNVVPLCDILLVLLIIFMVITPVAQKGIDIKLPETATELPEGPKNSNSIVLTLEKNGELKINQNPVRSDLLESTLRDLFQIRPNKTIFIRADSSTPYKKVLEIIDISKGAGIDVLGVICEKYESPQ